MKKLTLLPALLAGLIASAQNGYEIKVTLKPFANQTVYLGHYSGKQYPIIDSVRLDAASTGVFKGSKKLGGGIYLVAYPSKNKFLEILIDKQQHFSLIADTLYPTRTRFINSSDNDQFLAYQRFMSEKGKTHDSLRTAARNAASAADSTALALKQQAISATITAYRGEVIRKSPDNILSQIFHLMSEPTIPPADKQPGGRYDSTWSYQYFKNHYWDGINFWDDRFTRTPSTLFEDRIDKYFNTLVFPSADSVIKELDWMLGYASISPEMTRYLLVKFATRYLSMKYMWEDAVFVHLYQQYFANKEYSWLTPEGKKLITDRAYSLMANIMGNKAENIDLPDSTGAIRSLYKDTSRFTILVFWDPTCGHCKETLPILDSMYQVKWKNQGVKMFAVAKETDGTRKNWLDFVNQHGLNGWINVYYARADEKKRVDAGIPGYSQLFDVQVVPAIFLLDHDKRIVAKKLTWQQADEILQLKARTP
ncbi:MAG: thioredoxin-like domain-containing protein [Chitinophagaceae bacterium]